MKYKGDLFTTREKLGLVLQMLLSILYIILGLVIVFKQDILWSSIYWGLVSVLIATIVTAIYRLFFNRNPFQGLIAIGAGVFLTILMQSSTLYVELVAGLAGVWALFNAGVHGLEMYVAYKDNTKGKIMHFLYALFSAGMGFLLIFSGVENRYIINLQIGSYIALLGAIQMISTVRILFLHEIGGKLSAPVVLAAFMPAFLAKKTRETAKNNPEYFKHVVEETKGDYLSIYLYTKDDGFEQMGHLDIGYNGSIYSYGAHDPYNRAKSMAYGDGVLIVGSEKDFVQYAVDTNTIVFRFVCRLTPEQSLQIENQIESILKLSYYYEYPDEKDPEGEHYLTRLIQNNLRLNFYKFFDGKFRTYNVFTTNCVIVADQIVEATGMKLFQISGIATPGAYYDYLDKQVKKPGSIVIKKEVYRL